MVYIEDLSSIGAKGNLTSQELPIRGQRGYPSNIREELKEQQQDHITSCIRKKNP